MITLQQYVHHWIQMIWSWMESWLDHFLGRVLVMEDSRLRVRLKYRATPLAQGGFSMIYSATDVYNPSQKYALKQMRNLSTVNDEWLEQVQYEIQVHETLQRGQPMNAHYLMPLYGTCWEGKNHREVLYMLFPLYGHSLRDEINRRFYHGSSTNTTSCPWKDEMVVLKIFRHVCQAVLIMHHHQYTHRDVKLENILLRCDDNPSSLLEPCLMDFGSAGPLYRTIASRHDILDIPEQASQHTTISYRPPELFSGELHMPSATSKNDDDDDDNDNNHDDLILDYQKVDVWSLGCVLFALMYGASPLESEFIMTTTRNSNSGRQVLKIVPCSQLKVLSPIPQPPKDSPAATWYAPSLMQDLVLYMLNPNRHDRPTLPQVQARLEQVTTTLQLQQQQPKDLIQEHYFSASF